MLPTASQSINERENWKNKTLSLSRRALWTLAIAKVLHYYLPFPIPQPSMKRSSIIIMGPLSSFWFGEKSCIFGLAWISREKFFPELFAIAPHLGTSYNHVEISFDLGREVKPKWNLLIIYFSQAYYFRLLTQISDEKVEQVFVSRGCVRFACHFRLCCPHQRGQVFPPSRTGTSEATRDPLTPTRFACQLKPPGARSEIFILLIIHHRGCWTVFFFCLVPLPVTDASSVFLCSIERALCLWCAFRVSRGGRKVRSVSH